MREWRSRPPASPRPPGPLRRRLQSLLRRSASERWLLLRTWPTLLGVRRARALASCARVRAGLERRSARAGAAALAGVESEGRVVLGGEAPGRSIERRAGQAPPPGP